MIQANELRIGNFFLDRGGKLLRIDWFEHDKLCMSNPITVEPDEYFAPDGKMFGHPYTEDIEFANPIKLTEERLTDLGLRLKRIETTEHPLSQTTTVSKIYSTNKFDIDSMSTVDVIVVYNKGELMRIGILGIDCGDYLTHSDIKHVHTFQNIVFALTGEELQIK